MAVAVAAAAAAAAAAVVVVEGSGRGWGSLLKELEGRKGIEEGFRLGPAKGRESSYPGRSKVRSTLSCRTSEALGLPT